MCLTVAHLVNFFKFSFLTSDWPLCECYLMHWHNACPTSTMQSICYINANTSTCIKFVSLQGKKKNLPIYFYISIIQSSLFLLDEHRTLSLVSFQCSVLAGCLCAKRSGLTSRQCACHGVDSLCIPFYCISSCLRRNISMHDDSQKANNTFVSVCVLMPVFFNFYRTWNVFAMVR